jgi:hypothetical protein
MSFGLSNAPGVFMRTIKRALKDIPGDSILVFMDDILIPSTTVSEGLIILQKVLDLLLKADLKVKLEKCYFLQTKIDYLGHEVSGEGVAPGRAKISAVQDFRVPTNVHEVRQFVGLASYFRKFVKNFATIARPITQLTKKDVPWTWDSAQIDAFETLKEKLVSRPVLAIYDRDLMTELHTDASKFGLGGILMQVQSTGELKPVAYFSRVTSKEEEVYHSYELETLAVVESIKRFRIYLLGIHFKVVTDCVAVRATLVKRDMIPRIARWWLTIQEYDMEIEYRPGDRMKHVDALSRNPPICDVNVTQISTDDWVLTLQLQDHKLSALVEQLNGGAANKDIKNDFCIKDGRLYRRTLAGDRVVVPATAKWMVMRKFHDDIGHPGFERCEKLIKS